MTFRVLAAHHSHRLYGLASATLLYLYLQIVIFHLISFQATFGFVFIHLCGYLQVSLLHCLLNSTAVLCESAMKIKRK